MLEVSDEDYILLMYREKIYLHIFPEWWRIEACCLSICALCNLFGARRIVFEETFVVANERSSLSSCNAFRCDEQGGILFPLQSFLEKNSYEYCCYWCSTLWWSSRISSEDCSVCLGSEIQLHRGSFAFILHWTEIVFLPLCIGFPPQILKTEVDRTWSRKMPESIHKHNWRYWFH